MRLIDTDALLDHVIDIHCKNCERRKGIKNGKYRIIYEVGDVPCRICGIDDMKSYLEDAPTIEPQQWIPVSERLPEEDGLYLVTTSKGQVQMHVFNHNGNSEEYWTRCNKAWMPLPEPYHEDIEVKRMSKMRKING